MVWRLPLRVLVMGAGAVGSVYGALLHRAGHDVFLVTGEAHASAIKTGGLRLVEAATGRRDIFRVPAATRPPEGGAFDLVLVTLRYDQLRAAEETIQALAPRSGQLMLFGNGLDGDRVLADIAGQDKVTMGFGQVGGWKEPGLVSYHLARDEWTAIGELDGSSSKRILLARQAFESAGFRVRLEKNIRAWVMAHTAMVLPIALAVLSKGAAWERFGQSPLDTRLAARGMKDAVAVLRAFGVRLTAEARAAGALPEWLVAAMLRRKIVRDLEPEVRRAIWGHAVAGAAEWELIRQQFLKLAEERRVPLAMLARI